MFVGNKPFPKIHYTVQSYDFSIIGIDPFDVGNMVFTFIMKKNPLFYVFRNILNALHILKLYLLGFRKSDGMQGFAKKRGVVHRAEGGIFFFRHGLGAIDGNRRQRR